MPGHQLTGLARRVSAVRRALAGHGAGADPSAGQWWSAGAWAGAPPDLPWAAARAVRAGLSEGHRDRYDALLAATRTAAGRTVLGRTLAATGDPDAVAAVASLWPALRPGERAAVLDPATHLAGPGRQSDRTTCGSAALTLLAAQGDPLLALWLATGRLVGPRRPPELTGAPERRLAALAGRPPEARFACVHRVVKRRTNGSGGRGPRWPAALGTPPWGAARQARFAGVRFGHVLVSDTDRPHLEGVLAAVGAAVDHGVPALLYSGGDTGTGLWTAVPRHVVLVTARSAGGLTVVEPDAGRVHTVTREALMGGTRPLAALGGWTHVAWAVLPDPSSAPVVTAAASGDGGGHG